MYAPRRQDAPPTSVADVARHRPRSQQLDDATQALAVDGGRRQKWNVVVIVGADKSTSSRVRAMTLVARVTFLVLVGATFAAFFVAQRLKSAPPVIDVNGLATLLLAQRRRRRATQQRSRVVLKVADDATVDVVNLDGDRVRRLADGVPMRAYRPLRLSWDGTADDGGRAPDGQLPAARRAARRGPLGDRAEDDDVDTRAPRSEVCIGVPLQRPTQADGQHHLPGRPRGRRSTSRASRRATRRASASCAPTTASRARSTRFELAAGAHRCDWDGLRRRQAARRRAPTSSRPQVRDRAGNVGITPAELEPGADPGPPRPDRARASPPSRRVRPGDRGRARRSSSSTRAARRTAGACAASGDAAVRKRGTATRPAPRVPRAGGRRRASTCSSCARAAGTRRCRSSCRPSERSSVLVVVPDDHLARHRQGRRPAVRRPPEHARRRRHGALAARVRRRRTGCRPGFADDVAPLLVFLDRRRIRYDLTSDLDLDLTRNPRASRPRGRAARRLAALGHAHARRGGCAGTSPTAASSRSFGADTLRRGVRLRVLDDEDAGHARARDPAGRGRPVRRARRASRGRCRRAGRRSASTTASRDVRADGGRARPARASRGSRSRRRSARASCSRPSASRSRPRRRPRPTQPGKARARAAPGADARSSSARAR